MEREALRAKATDLLNRLRGTDVSQVVYELFDNICRRLDRLELGSFSTEEETPTRPDRHPSGQVAATKQDDLSGRIKEIFSDAKKPGKGGE